MDWPFKDFPEDASTWDAVVKEYLRISKQLEMAESLLNDLRICLDRGGLY